MKPLRLIDFPPPKWKKWRNIPEVEFWQGAALVFNIEPDALQNYTSWHGSAFRVMDLVVPEELRDLYEILMSNARKIDPKWRGSTRVDLRRLGRFVSSIEGDGYSLPPEFPVALDESKAMPNLYMTEALRRLCEVAGQFYADGGGPQKELAAKLMGVLWVAPTSQQKRAMETLAAILRPVADRRKDRRVEMFRFEE